MTRVYLPTTLEELAVFVAAGEVPASVDRYVAQDESEDSEYDALAAAAEDSAEMLAGPGRRVVVVAEVADPDAAFALDRVVAVHADDEVVAPDARDLPDLGWYATQEIGALLASR
ncbi:DUF6912 family protein [Nocardioides marmorisolisilvae]|uniref:Uncharacterized protein n=1 Tax=Nocardioides marmorisolisilvae TaxID=1542737 RepID=A0A3N0DSN3_9ACTN|nr:hypothetical protein [Nocardioides marmorisolisilvae]RNL78655.1 hypothetical protein EFL95_06100 [Nocardioides marmorisolisilvae]